MQQCWLVLRTSPNIDFSNPGAVLRTCTRRCATRELGLAHGIARLLVEATCREALSKPIERPAEELREAAGARAAYQARPHGAAQCGSHFGATGGNGGALRLLKPLHGIDRRGSGASGFRVHARHRPLNQFNVSIMAAVANAVVIATMGPTYTSEPLGEPVWVYAANIAPNVTAGVHPVSHLASH